MLAWNQIRSLLVGTWGAGPADATWPISQLSVSEAFSCRLDELEGSLVLPGVTLARGSNASSR